MAVYSGTWTVDATPFDPNAKATPNPAGGGGTAAVRRRRINYHPMHAPFVASIRRQRDHWWNTLDADNRATWEDPDSDQAANRKSITPTDQTRFVLFSSKSFVDQWHDGLTEVLEASPGTFAPDGAANFVINVAAQTITFDLTYPADFLWQENPAVATYQVSPRYARSPRPWRQTRLIDLHHTWTPGGGIYSPSLSLAWPVAPSDHAAFFLRARSGFTWTWRHLETMTPPH